jgi:glycerate kinase
MQAKVATSEGCAEAIKHSMKKINDTIAVFLKGCTTDSGGGGVLESLANEMKKEPFAR